MGYNISNRQFKWVRLKNEKLKRNESKKANKTQSEITLKLMSHIKIIT